MFIVTKQIDSENISKLCRTCLREDGEKMVCLFVGPAGSSLAAKLRSLSCLEVWQGDGLPEKLCDRCVTRAESALLFREQCRAADRALRQAASKVSGHTRYTTVSGCKLYEQSQGFTPLETSQKTLKCTDCGAVFMNYQELCVHSRLHNQYAHHPTQHMHIVESNHGYFLPDLPPEPVINNSNVQVPALEPEESNRAACALHCSLCNHTFSNRSQLINHNFSHCDGNVDLSCDDSIEIGEDSNEIAQNLSFHQYPRTNEACSMVDGMNFAQNLTTNSTVQSKRSLNKVSAEKQDSKENLDADLSSHMNQNLKGNMDPNLPDDLNQNLSENLNRNMNENLSQELTGNVNQEQNINQNIPQKFNQPTKGTLNDNLIENLNQNISEALPYSKFNELEKKSHKCSYCSKTFSQKSKLKTHEFAHTGHRPFKCRNCDKGYTSKSKLTAHMRLHTRTNIHQCNICEKTFSYLSYLKDHQKTHEVKAKEVTSRPKEFQCSVCLKQFRLKKNLKAHLRLHSGEGLLTCEICDKIFNQKYNLKVHMKIHKGLKQHKCEFCSKSFAEKGNYTEHLRIHTKVKPFSCNVCGKSFSQSSHLKSHESTHSSTRPHQCTLCGKRFKLLSHLKRHTTLHSSVKSFKCMQCDQMFSQAFSLKRHLKRHSET